MTRTVVLTGATDGLGRAVAEALARDPENRLILHGRNPERLAALRRELGSEVITVQADLAELAQVHRLADHIIELTDQVTVLVNNAGVGSGEPDGTERRLTVDGHELRFAVNHLAAFALTRRLLPLLEAGAPARVVNVASLGQAPISFGDLTLSRGYDGVRAYCQSKLAMITCGFTLAERHPADKVTVNSLHPGTYMPTKMVLESIGYSVDSLKTGVDATLRLINDPALAGVTGQFFDRTREARALPEAYDPEVRRRLWEISERLTARRS